MATPSMRGPPGTFLEGLLFVLVLFGVWFGTVFSESETEAPFGGARVRRFGAGGVPLLSQRRRRRHASPPPHLKVLRAKVGRDALGLARRDHDLGALGGPRHHHQQTHHQHHPPSLPSVPSGRHLFDLLPRLAGSREGSRRRARPLKIGEEQAARGGRGACGKGGEGETNRLSVKRKKHVRARSFVSLVSMLVFSFSGCVCVGDARGWGTRADKGGLVLATARKTAYRRARHWGKGVNYK